MSPEIEKQIFDRWPHFFTHKSDIRRSAMAFGFACEDGWRDLLWHLFTRIEQTLGDVGNEAETENFEIVQVKQKFGTLRVYAHNTSPRIKALIQEAIAESRSTCEMCGAPGKLFQNTGWWVTLCAACAPRNPSHSDLDHAAAPQVGIFWVVNGRLILDGTPLDKAEPWDNRYLNDPRSHQKRWEHYKAVRLVPVRADWAHFPRGRVIYDQLTNRFQIYADLCILNDPEMMARIEKELKLPPDTPASGDDHYRCSICMRRSR